MRLSLAFFFILSMAVLTACQTGSELDSAPGAASEEAAPEASAAPAAESPKVDDHGHEDTAPRIELADAKSLFDAGEALFIDTRSFTLTHLIEWS